MIQVIINVLWLILTIRRRVGDYFIGFIIVYQMRAEESDSRSAIRIIQLFLN